MISKTIWLSSRYSFLVWLIFAVLGEDPSDHGYSDYVEFSEALKAAHLRIAEIE
jgi:hypothetical protein